MVAVIVRAPSLRLAASRLSPRLRGNHVAANVLHVASVTYGHQLAAALADADVDQVAGIPWTGWPKCVDYA